MDLPELIDFFRSIKLPTEPIRLNDFMTVTNAPLFIDGLIKLAKTGDNDARQQLEQFKVALIASLANDS
ncbi:MAG: hypothetical protein JWP57_4313 [Spirosoma sp.]|nr:hypothetical protein [Spirosoma sp.]